MALGGLWFGSQSACQRYPSAHPEYRMLAERLARLPKERKALRTIGSAYLASLDERPTAEQIAAGWFPSETERRRALALKPQRLAQHVADRTLEDYRHDRVVSVRGWLLSETEARFAALTALVRHW